MCEGPTPSITRPPHTPARGCEAVVRPGIAATAVASNRRISGHCWRTQQVSSCPVQGAAGLLSLLGASSVVLRFEQLLALCASRPRRPTQTCLGYCRCPREPLLCPRQHLCHVTQHMLCIAGDCWQTAHITLTRVVQRLAGGGYCRRHRAAAWRSPSWAQVALVVQRQEQAGGY